MTTKEHTVETAYGTTSIEVYDCDSCGNTVPYDETVDFEIGEREGRACKMCEQKGPISFPAKVLEYVSPVKNGEWSLLYWVVSGVFFCPPRDYGRSINRSR